MKKNNYPTQFMPILTLITIISTLIGYGYLSGYRLFVIASGSMEPSLSIGTLIVTTPLSRYHSRQVITYYKTMPELANYDRSKTSYNLVAKFHNLVSKTYSKSVTFTKAYNAKDILKKPEVTTEQRYAVTHRIISSLVDNGEILYRTQGDANPHPDLELVPHNTVVGKVWLAIPLLGFLFLLPHYKIGFYFIVLLPALLLIVSHLFKIVQLLISLKNRIS